MTRYACTVRINNDTTRGNVMAITNNPCNKRATQNVERKTRKPTVSDFRDMMSALGTDPDSDDGIQTMRTAIEKNVVYIPSYAQSPLSNYSIWQFDMLSAIKESGVLVSVNQRTHELEPMRKHGHLGMTLNSVGEPVAFNWRYSLDNAQSWLKAHKMDNTTFREEYFNIVGFNPAPNERKKT